MSEVDPEPEAGPFRTAEPTGEARRAKEHAASFERVAEATARAIEAERRGRQRMDTISGLALVGSILLLGACLGLAMIDRGGPWLPLACPAVASTITLGVVFFHRARLVRRRW